MAQTSYPWDGEVLGDAGPYSSEQWANAWNALFNGALAGQYNAGVVLESGNSLNAPLLVDVDSPVSNQVRVFPGDALVQGRFYTSDAIELVTISANGTADPRIDRIVLRTIFASQEIRLFTIEGTPAAVPVAPSLVQSNVVFDIPLAQVLVPSGFVNITTGITDERTPSTWLTTRGGTGINSKTTPFSKGDLIVALSAEVLQRLAVGANGRRLVADSTQSLGIKWVDIRPSIVMLNTGGASSNITNATLISDTIVTDQASNISSIDGSGYIVPVAGTYKVKALLSYSHTTAVASAIGQLVLYDNIAAANILDTSGATVLSNGVNLLNGAVGGGSCEIPEHICTFTGAEALSLRIVTGFGAGAVMRRTKNPIISFERVL